MSHVLIYVLLFTIRLLNKLLLTRIDLLDTLQLNVMAVVAISSAVRNKFYPHCLDETEMQAFIWEQISALPLRLCHQSINKLN
jgi:hypothetical protein